MIPDGTTENEGEQYFSPGAVAGRFLVRIEDVYRWIDEGRLQSVSGRRGRPMIAESALLDFQRTAYRRENFSGVDHALHSWPSDDQETTNLPMIPVQNFEQAEAKAPNWPFPHGGGSRLPSVYINA